MSDSSVGSHGFRSWYGWGAKGELMEAGGSRYMLSTVLGVTYGRGNTLGEILRYLEAGTKADGTASRRARFTLWRTAISARPRASPGSTWQWNN